MPVFWVWGRKEQEGRRCSNRGDERERQWKWVAAATMAQLHLQKRAPNINETRIKAESKKTHPQANAHSFPATTALISGGKMLTGDRWCYKTCLISMRMSRSIPSIKQFLFSADTCPPLLELFPQFSAFKYLKHTWASLEVSSENAQLPRTSLSSQHVTHIVFIWIRLSRVHWSLWMGSWKSKRLAVTWPFRFICHVPGWLIG